jgi:segregation and condensation protein B
MMMDEQNTDTLIEALNFEAIHYPRVKDLEDPDVEAILAKVDALDEVENFELELDYFDEQLQEDKLWQARTGLNPDTLCGAIETVIFMSDKPVPLTKIKGLIDEDLPLRMVHASLERLQNEYERKHHGLRLVEVAEGYQFRTKATYSRFVQDLFKVNQLVLSPTALEVLAIIAYRQPASKTDVDKIRGVDSSHIVRGLMDKRLVKIVGRSQDVGRPTLYGTTLEFLEVFNLANLSELPPEYELKEMATQSVGKISDIKTLVHADDKGRFVFDEMDELDDLSDSIKSIASDTDFTKSLKVEEKKRTSDEGGEVKTAFDLLEDFVNKNVILKENLRSVLSHLPVAGVEPKIISDLTEGPFNTPQDEEEFEMIDLETGEPIKDELEATAEESTDFDELQAEKEALGKALDDAFDRLTRGSEMLGDEKEKEEDELLFGDESDLKQKERDLEGLGESMAESAKDLDLDLDFLKNTENSENSTDPGLESEDRDN